jgi:signal transduction histidine kinase
MESLLLHERSQWALHIHDGLTQAVTSAVLELHSLRKMIQTDPDRAIATIDEIEGMLRQDLSEIRQLLFELENGSRGGKEPTIAGLIRDLGDRWRIRAHVVMDGDVEGIPDRARETAHAVIAEAMANAAKHSGAAEVTVSILASAERVRIQVRDQGRGMVFRNDPGPHFGIRHMRSRVQEVGGTIDIESTPGHGTSVVAVIPVGMAR